MGDGWPVGPGQSHLSSFSKPRHGSTEGPPSSVSEQLTHGGRHGPSFSLSSGDLFSPIWGDGSAHLRVVIQSAEDDLLLTHDPEMIARWAMMRGAGEVQISEARLIGRALGTLLASPTPARPGASARAGC